MWWRGNRIGMLTGSYMLSESAHLFSILGVDIGGTFTDIVYYTPPLTADSTGQLIVHNTRCQVLPRTPRKVY
jgi:hypothetical protein